MLRSHGAATFVLFGEQVGSTAAPLQITAYVASGVGFLGGGVILRQGLSVQGLNTADTLWCSAAIGCQAAAGHVIPALAVTGIVSGVHVVLRPFGRLVDRVPATKNESVALYTLRSGLPQLGVTRATSFTPDKDVTSAEWNGTRTMSHVRCNTCCSDAACVA
jgi:uncharacterized membrane protein YhiD involved in acid resistance